jgi:hypothetical protein
MRDRGGKLFEATLSVGNLKAEQVLMVAIERLAFQVFVGRISLLPQRAPGRPQLAG